jgi:hypothetical protein
MALRPQERERGLGALNEARQTRRRAVVFGRVRVREAATGFWLVSMAGLAIFSFAYYRYSLVELEGRRSEVRSRQRAVAAAVGTRGFDLRDRIEGWVIALAEGKLPEQVAPEASLDELAKGPTIYLRLRASEAHAVDSIRKAAKGSLRDGFTSCLFVGGAADPSQGAACTVTSQCGPGELCSDWNVCAAPAHPYNMRFLYDGLRVLTPDWSQALEATDDELQVRAMEINLQSVGKHEAVIAAELARRSKYFTAVLDEDAAPGETAAAPALAGESLDEQLQTVDHLVRVGIWDVERAVPLASLKVAAAGRFVRLGSGAIADPRTLRAQQRQANNCAVAMEVRDALAAARAPGPEAPGVPAPVAEQ